MVGAVGLSVRPSGAVRETLRLRLLGFDHQCIIVTVALTWGEQRTPALSVSLST